MEKNSWQPIATAPVFPFDQENWYDRASPYFLLWGEGICNIGVYHYTSKGKGYWKDDYGRQIFPTHWMHLPPEPEVKE